MSSRTSDSSKLSKIEDIETNPTDLFSKWVDEVKKHRKDASYETMSLASLNK